MFAVVTKIHHAAIDGVSGAEVIARLLDSKPIRPTSGLRPAAWHPEPVPTDLELVADAGRELIGQDPSRRGRRATGRHGDRQRSGRDRQTWRWAPKTMFNVAITPHRRFATAEVSLEDVKAIREGVGATVNDVVLALSAGALRQSPVGSGGRCPKPRSSLWSPSRFAPSRTPRTGQQRLGHADLPRHRRQRPPPTPGRIAEATSAAKAEDPAIDVATAHRMGRAACPRCRRQGGPGAHRIVRWWTASVRCSTWWSPTSEVRTSRCTWPAPSWSGCGRWVPSPTASALNITVMSYLGQAALRAWWPAGRPWPTSTGWPRPSRPRSHVLLRAVPRPRSRGPAGRRRWQRSERSKAAAGAGLLT